MPRVICAALLAAVTAGCSRSAPASGSAADSSAPAAARAIPAAAFRLGEAGSGLAVYSLPTLDSTPWGAGGRVSGARSAIGVDMAGGRLLFRDSSGAVSSFDLVSLRQRQVGPRRTAAAIGADGTLLVVDSAGAVTESQIWGTREWSGSLGRGIRAAFAAPGQRLIAVRHTRAGDSLEIVTRENGVTSSAAVPAANDIAASRDGDALAFATDSGVTVFEDRDLDQPWFVRIAGTPTTVIFSPSGHRLYVALKDRDELAVIDRFAQKARSGISLPGRAAALRNDPWGRAVLVRGGGAGTEETWIVGVADNDVEGRLKGSWSTDLPTVTQTGVLLSREGSAVVARDLRTLDSLGAVPGAARDVWFTGRWVPSSASARAVAANAPPPPATRTPDGGKAPVTAAAPTTAAARPAAPAVQQPPAPPTRAAIGQAQPHPAAATPAEPGSRPAAAGLQPQAAFYTQFIATRSEEAARSLAASMTGEHVQVVAPRSGVGDENWRVMVGPFRSREAADSAGRSLGRPFWVVDRSRDGGRP